MGVMEERPKSSRKRRKKNDSAAATPTYFHDLRQYALLTRDEEHEIAVKYAETRDVAFRDKLVRANLRLVLKIAGDYKTVPGKYMDLVQEGNLGLLRAIEKFDPSAGTKLATYAVWWIKAYMLKYIMNDARLVKIGTTQSQRSLFFSLRKARATFGEGEEATRQISEKLNVKVKEVLHMDQRLGTGETSLDNLVIPAPANQRRPDHDVETHDAEEARKRAFASFQDKLSDREKEIYERRLLADEPATLLQISEKFDISRERVRQIEARLKGKLARHLQNVLGDDVYDLAS